MPGPPTYVVDMHHSKRRRIRLCCLPSKRRRCSCVVWGWSLYNIVESESDPLTRRPVDLFEKEPLKGNSEVHLHTPTKFGEDPSKDLGGDREHTHKRCSNYTMIPWNNSRHGLIGDPGCIQGNTCVRKHEMLYFCQTRKMMCLFPTGINSISVTLQLILPLRVKCHFSFLPTVVNKTCLL